MTEKMCDSKIYDQMTIKVALVGQLTHWLILPHSPLYYCNDFWRIMWHRRLEEWCWKFSFDHRNKLHFNIYSNRKHLF